MKTVKLPDAIYDLNEHRLELWKLNLPELTVADLGSLPNPGLNWEDCGSLFVYDLERLPNSNSNLEIIESDEGLQDLIDDLRSKGVRYFVIEHEVI